MIPVPAVALLKAVPWRYVFAVLAVLGVLVAVEQYGEGRIQEKWDEETRQRKEKLAEQERTDKEVRDAIERQREADVAAAVSDAGRSAVADYVRRNGLRVSCPGRGKAEGSEVTDGGSGEQGAGGGIEGFATNCALDALHVLRWQEWARRQELPVE